MDLQPTQPAPKPFPLLPVLLVLLVLLLVSTAYLTFQNLQLKKQIFALQSSPIPPISQITPTLPDDPTENWKTYTASNFTFKYPSNLKQLNGGVSGPLNGSPKMLVTFAEPSTVLENTDATFDGFSVYTANLSGENFEEFIKKEKDNREKRDIEFWDATGKTTQSISQRSGNMWTTLNGPAFPDITVYYLPLPDGKNIIAFGMSKKSDTFPKVFDQILSTFTFLGQLKPIDSSAWQTSGDRTNSFQIKHPSTVVYGESTDGYARFGFYGPQQKLNSEISDGFVILIKLVRRQNNNPTLSTYVDNKIEYSKVTSDIIKQKSTISVAGYSGYTYSVRGQGELQYIFLNWPELAPYPASILEIITVVSDTNQSKYQHIVDTMLETLKYSSQ